jgi:uncharacterized protein YjbI with pentapeptide repeats
MSETLLGVLIGSGMTLLGLLITLWAQDRRTRRERMYQQRLRLVSEYIQTSEVLDFIRSQRKRAWPRFWKRGEPDLSRTNLEKIDLREQDLRGVKLFRANLSKADLDSANLRGVDLGKADLSEADLSKANLSEADLRGANLSGAILSGANLHAARLHRADLEDADLRSADLEGADLYATNLHSATIDHLTRVDEKWRLAWRIVNHPTEGWYLSCADLERTNLRGVDLSGADLEDANLREINLEGANLLEANLLRVILSRAKLLRATLFEQGMAELDEPGRGQERGPRGPLGGKAGEVQLGRSSSRIARLASASSRMALRSANPMSSPLRQTRLSWRAMPWLNW